MSVNKISINGYQNNILPIVDFSIDYAYIKKSGAIEHGSQTSWRWRMTELIPVTSGMKFILYSYGNNITASAVFYDYNEKVIKTFPSEDFPNPTVINETIPNCCSYVRFCSLYTHKSLGPDEGEFVPSAYFYYENAFKIIYDKAFPYYFILDQEHRGFISNGNIIFVPNSAWYFTDLIPVSHGVVYDIKLYGLSGVDVVDFYDKDKKLVDFIDGEPIVEQQRTYTVLTDSFQENIYYVRFCSYFTDNESLENHVWLDYSKKVNNTGLVKLEYKDGYIPFYAPINQYIPNPNDTQNICIDNEDEFIDVICYLKLPNNYTETGKPSKLVAICHGAGSAVTEWVRNSSYNNIVNYLNNAGYAIFDCNGWSNESSGYNFWGCPKGVSAWRKAYDYITQNYNVETNINIYGFSMGGLTALNLVLNNFPNVKCIALGSPVINLDSCWGASPHDNMVLGYGTDDYSQISPGNNPYASIYTENNKLYFNKQIPPIRIWYGSTETNRSGLPYVEKNDAINLVTALKNSNQTASYREVDGCGHEICYGANLNIVNEIVMYFNRFNY